MIETEFEYNIIFVEDNSVLREELKFQLQANGVQITAVSDGVALLSEIQNKEYHIAIVDIGLPGENGLSLVNKLRHKYPDIWVIILTAQDSIETRLNSFERGIDVFLVKPVSWKELLAQINAFKRRIGQNKQRESARWQLKSSGRELSIQKRVVLKLTHMEGIVLTELAHNSGQIVSREHIIKKLEPNKAHSFDPHRLESCISRLRQKIKAVLLDISNDGENREDENTIDIPLKTSRGKGYIFTDSISVDS